MPEGGKASYSEMIDIGRKPTVKRESKNNRSAELAAKVFVICQCEVLVDERQASQMCKFKATNKEEKK